MEGGGGMSSGSDTARSGLEDNQVRPGLRGVVGNFAGVERDTEGPNCPGTEGDRLAAQVAETGTAVSSLQSTVGVVNRPSTVFVPHFRSLIEHGTDRVEHQASQSFFCVQSRPPHYRNRFLL